MESSEDKGIEYRKVHALERIADNLQKIVDRLLSDEEEDYQ